MPTKKSTASKKPKKLEKADVDPPVPAVNSGFVLTEIKKVSFRGVVGDVSKHEASHSKVNIFSLQLKTYDPNVLDLGKLPINKQIIITIEPVDAPKIIDSPDKLKYYE